MKRTERQISILEKFMVATALISCLLWVAGWVTLIFNLQLGLQMFVVSFSFLLLYLFFAAMWGICLNARRKKVTQIVYQICNHFKRKEDVLGKFDVSIESGTLICVSFYTHSIGAIDENELRSMVEVNIPNEFCLIYKEILKD